MKIFIASVDIDMIVFKLQLIIKYFVSYKVHPNAIFDSSVVK